MIPARLPLRYEFTPVPSCGSVFAFIIPAQNLIPERDMLGPVHCGLVTPYTAGCYKTALTRGEGVRSLLRAKGFTWVLPVGYILVLVRRFDREVVITF